MQPAPGFPHPPYYQNGFLAFGDDPSDEQLVKCGIQFIQGTVVINQGLTSGSKKTQQKLNVDVTKPIPATVTLDLERQEVELKTAGQTIQTKLNDRLDPVEFIGYATWNAVTDFGPIEVIGE